jgi:hypothetical protein
MSVTNNSAPSYIHAGLERSLDKEAASRAIAALCFKQTDGQRGTGGAGDRSRLFG